MIEHSIPSLKFSCTCRSIDMTRDKFQRYRARYVDALYPSITSLTFTSAATDDEDNITVIKVTLLRRDVTRMRHRMLVVIAIFTNNFQIRVLRLISRVKAHRVIDQLMSSYPDSGMFNSVRQRYVDRYTYTYIRISFLISLQKCLAFSVSGLSAFVPILYKNIQILLIFKQILLIYKRLDHCEFRNFRIRFSNFFKSLPFNTFVYINVNIILMKF